MNWIDFSTGTLLRPSGIRPSCLFPILPLACITRPRALSFSPISTNMCRGAASSTPSHVTSTAGMTAAVEPVPTRPRHRFMPSHHCGVQAFTGFAAKRFGACSGIGIGIGIGIGPKLLSMHCYNCANGLTGSAKTASGTSSSCLPCRAAARVASTWSAVTTATRRNQF